MIDDNVKILSTLDAEYKAAVLLHGESSHTAAAALVALGASLLDSGEFADALRYSERALSICSNYNNAQFLAEVLQLLVEISASMGNLDLALRYNTQLVECCAPESCGNAGAQNFEDQLGVQADLESRLGYTAEAAATLARHNTLLRRSQSHCAGPGCPRRIKADGASLERCAACLCTFYCSVACQTADWNAGHKAECAALIANTAAGGGAGVGSGPTKTMQERLQGLQADWLRFARLERRQLAFVAVYFYS